MSLIAPYGLATFREIWLIGVEILQNHIQEFKPDTQDHKIVALPSS